MNRALEVKTLLLFSFYTDLGLATATVTRDRGHEPLKKKI